MLLSVRKYSLDEYINVPVDKKPQHKHNIQLLCGYKNMDIVQLVSKGRWYATDAYQAQ